MNIYTKTGDLGETGLIGGGRVEKDHPRVEAVGTVDELGATLGMVQTEPLPDEIHSLLTRIQNELFSLSAELASTDAPAHGVVAIGRVHVETLEENIDLFEQGLAPLREFIVPGGTKAAAALHLARVVCRRAERRVVTLTRIPDENVSENVICYLNRLGDLLFSLTRAVNAAAGKTDVTWDKSI